MKSSSAYKCISMITLLKTPTKKTNAQNIKLIAPINYSNNAANVYAILQI